MKKIMLLIVITSFFIGCINVEKQQQELNFQKKVKNVKVVETKNEIENCSFVKDIKVDTYFELELLDQIDAIDFSIEKVAEAGANTFLMTKFQLLSSGRARDTFLIEGKAYNCN
jgi:hypothetical protein